MLNFISLSFEKHRKHPISHFPMPNSACYASKGIGNNQIHTFRCRIPLAMLRKASETTKFTLSDVGFILLFSGTFCDEYTCSLGVHMNPQK